MAQLALDKYRKREYSNNMMKKGTEMQVFLTFCEENFLEAFATEELAQRFIECMSEENGGNYYYFATEVLER